MIHGVFGGDPLSKIGSLLWGGRLVCVLRINVCLLETLLPFDFLVLCSVMSVPGVRVRGDVGCLHLILAVLWRNNPFYQVADPNISNTSWS